MNSIVELRFSLTHPPEFQEELQEHVFIEEHTFLEEEVRIIVVYQEKEGNEQDSNHEASAMDEEAYLLTHIWNLTQQA